MKLVIAGGTGLIGSALAAHAEASEHDVVILSRSAPVSDIGRTVIWDGQTRDGWVTELEDADVVINLCGANIGRGRWTSARKAEIRNSRIAPAQCLISALQTLSDQPKYLQASAVGFYGTGDTPVDESSTAGDDYLARLAVEWEASARSYAGPWTIARFGVVLATNEGALPTMALPFKLFVGGKLGRGDQWFSWITLEDAVSALLFCIHQDLRGEVNIVAPRPVTNHEFTRALAAALNRPSILTAPEFALRILLGEQASLMLGGQKAMPSRLRDAGFTFVDPAIGPALQKLMST
jgi:uncharacterized protein (TIGR01777 family)